MTRPFALPGSYLVLETTNQCSLACVHCTVAEGAAHPHHARPGFLPLATAEALFDDLVATGAHFDALVPFWLGEPLIHPEFGAIYRAGLRAAARGAFARVELHTNATHLGRDRVRIALNASPVPQTWHLSLDAASRDTYARIKGRDSFEEVEANVLAFLDEKVRSGAPWPRPVFQMILSGNNAPEAGAFRSRWTAACRDRGIAVRVAAQHVPSGTDAVVFFRQLDAPTPEAQAGANRDYREAVSRLGLALPREDRTPRQVDRGPGICACFWKSPVVSWDGNVTTCTRDNRLQNVLGNVHEQPFSEIWFGGQMRATRHRVATGNYEKLPACHGCYIPRSANYTDITPAEIRVAS
ncbi:MAG: radical SAM protein [Deltaproteobacteria bacterium]|nr:radical SAM protein [Deltaproteobacteria bacterium]